MARKRISVDIEELLVRLLQEREIPEEDLANRVYITTIVDMRNNMQLGKGVSTYPLISVDPVRGTGRSIPNADYDMGAWTWIVNFTIYDRDQERCSEVADWLYEALHTFDGEQISIPGVGMIFQTEDNGLPTRTNQTTYPDGSGDLVEYNGSFKFIVVMPRT